MSMNVKYWLKRDEYRHKHYINQVDDILKELNKYYSKYQRELYYQVKILRLTVQSHPSKANKEKLQAVEDRIGIIDTIINNINYTVENLTTTYLVSNYIWEMTNILPDIERTLNKVVMFGIPDGKTVEEIIRQNWSGLTYSQRIWRNSQNLSYNLKETILNGVIKGSSYDQMVRELSLKMNSDKKKTYRLIKTELKAAITRADLDTYEKAGLQYVETITSGKDNVCRECKRLAHKKIRIDKAIPGVNIAPYHPLCTCSVIPVVNIKVPITSDTIELE